MSAYFTLEDSAALQLIDSASRLNPDVQVIYEKFYQLQHSINLRLRELSWDLHPHSDKTQLISSRSAASSDMHGVALRFCRSREQALAVERLMGREGEQWAGGAEKHRHPVIELRLTPSHFAVELIVSADAWLDQQNLVSKLAVPRHRQTLRGIIGQMPATACIGFWRGLELDDMHLTAGQLSRGLRLDDWLSTFQDGHDYLRAGLWYQPQDDALSVNTIVSEATRQIGALYRLYDFLLFSSNNDFRTFYARTLEYHLGKETRLS